MDENVSGNRIDSNENQTNQSEKFVPSAVHPDFNQENISFGEDLQQQTASAPHAVPQTKPPETQQYINPNSAPWMVPPAFVPPGYIYGTPQPPMPSNNLYNRQNIMPYNPNAGFQYNPNFNYGYPPVPLQKPDANLGVKIFLSIFFSVLGILILGYVIYLGSLFQRLSSDNDVQSEYTTPTKDEDRDNEQEETPTDNTPDIETLLDPENEGIILLPLPSDKNIVDYSIQGAFTKVGTAIVGIACYENEEKALEDSEDNVLSQGTGIIVTEGGYIVTNSHVIFSSRKYFIKVITFDQNEYTADVVGYDVRTDLAVLKINASDLKTAAFGDSDLITIGDDVIAIGNPGGLNFQNSLTKGIISAVNRKVSTSSTVRYIQTDTAINPGNSGGPLCNIYGQVIGINTVKIAAPMYEGMGFSIPSNTVKEIVNDLIRQGYVEGRVRIGISGIDVNKDMSAYYGVPIGVRIESIAKDGPLYGKGVKKGDILTKIDDTEISSIQEIYAFLAGHRHGDKVNVEFYRSGSAGIKSKTFSVEIELAADQGETQN